MQAGVWLAPLMLTVVAVIILVVSDFYDYRLGRYLAKPLASLGFVWLAVALGASHSNYGRWLLAGLVCCLVGDLLLMPSRERSLLHGLGAFLLGHLLYAVAFVQLNTNIAGLVVGSPLALGLLIVTSKWLAPYVNESMKTPITVYTLVITAMLLCACLSAGHPASVWVLAGSFGFAISDLAVAREHFVARAASNGVWGTPLYFGSQSMLAFSVSAV